MPLHVHGMNQGTKRQDKKEHKIKIKVIEKMGKKTNKNCESEQINRRVQLHPCWT